MNEKTLLYVTLGVAVAGLVVTVILAQHLNETADSVDKGTAGLLGNQKVQSLLTGVAGLFGGKK